MSDELPSPGSPSPGPPGDEAQAHSKHAGPSPAAVYLVGQGPQREPHLIELQWARVLRYVGLVSAREAHWFQPLDTFVDLNFPRVYDWSPEAFPELAALLQAAAKGVYRTVFVDLCGWSEASIRGFDCGYGLLRRTGARVINVLEEGQQAIAEDLRQQWGDEASLLLPDAGPGELIALFPTLAAGIIQKFRQFYDLDERPPQSPDRMDGLLDMLRRENPWARAGGGIPIFSEGAWFKYSRRAGERRERELEARRSVEPLHRIRPGEAGLLVDEHRYGEVRSQSELEWATRRLREELQFELRLEDRTQSFERTVGDLLVLADPRGRGRIDFHVFRLPPATMARNTGRGRSKAAAAVGTFYILDHWTADLEGKFLARVAQVAATIARKRSGGASGNSL